ncbi:GNAT family N-acetyltransferase [Nocardia amamiensis]|uniref:GNAT family N-acetyltransferase n=1 Tax=Nocardia amamiensis TaxID=404578 RepID=UPI00083240B7|nr:GNAT family N-acetyltransferase [Nocardia amamiensis]
MSNQHQPMSFSIETERLSLRLRGPEDTECTLRVLGERDGGTTATFADVRGSLIRQRVRAMEDGFGLLSVRRRAEQDRIGYCGLIVGRGSFDEPEIAYELLRSAQGQGYATEAARAVVEAAFATGRRRLWSTVRVWNQPSFRVLEKIGFHRHHSICDERGELVYLMRDA